MGFYDSPQRKKSPHTDTKHCNNICNHTNLRKPQAKPLTLYPRTVRRKAAASVGQTLQPITFYKYFFTLRMFLFLFRSIFVSHYAAANARPRIMRSCFLYGSGRKSITRIAIVKRIANTVPTPNAPAVISIPY